MTTSSNHCRKAEPYTRLQELDVEFKSIRTYVKIWKLWHLHKPIGPPQPNKKFRFE